jgi:hypothetical protein
VLFRSARNIEGVQVKPVAEFNTYEILKQRYLLLTREALSVLREGGQRVATRRFRPDPPVPSPLISGQAGSGPITVKVAYSPGLLPDGSDIEILSDSLEVRPTRRGRGQDRILCDLGSLTGWVTSAEGLILPASGIPLPEEFELASEPDQEMVRIKVPTRRQFYYRIPADQLDLTPVQGMTAGALAERMDEDYDEGEEGGGRRSGDAFDLGLEPPPTTSQLKRPLIWVAQRDGEEPPLQFGTTYPLHIQMGDPGSRTLMRGSAGDIPIDDIPPEGLLTDWVASSREVALEEHPDCPEVKSSIRTYDEERSPDIDEAKGEGPGGWRFTIWSARFELLVPREGSSAVRTIAIRPLDPSRGRIDFLIYLRGDASSAGPNELYRWFHVDLPLATDSEGEAVHDPRD